MKHNVVSIFIALICVVSMPAQEQGTSLKVDVGVSQQAN